MLDRLFSLWYSFEAVNDVKQFALQRRSYGTVGKDR